MAGLSGIAAISAHAQTNDLIRIIALGGAQLVEYLPHGTEHWQPVAVGTELAAWDRVRTSTNSSVSMLWADNSVLRFEALTELEVLPPDRDDADHGLHLLSGLFSFFHRDQPGRIRVITSGAMAGIKGTEFIMAVKPENGGEQTTLAVIDGLVNFSNTQGALELTNNEQAVANANQAPQRTAGFTAKNLVQWSCYYPGVLDMNDLPLTAPEKTDFAESLTAYRAGDLLLALKKFPANQTTISAAAQIYHAALLLNSGQMNAAETELAAPLMASTSENNTRLVAALHTLIAAVKAENLRSEAKPQLASEFLAASYYAQSQVGKTSLAHALELARQAVAQSPEFGFAWERVAELEFSFGRIEAASAALEKALQFSPRNAEALSLKGFLLAAKNQTTAALAEFDRALAVDSALGNAWLGRGLCRIRNGDLKAGREDLLIAAAMEPQRAVLRSYLGKAFSNVGDTPHAQHELNLAKQLDPNDSTAWLYSALLNEQNNQLNDAVTDLEKSQTLNQNRSVYRSSLLLDQDRAVRSANLARIYDEAGLGDVAVREAARAVTADYGNFSAHLFLANSYEQLRAANAFDLRYETPAYSEYLLANLLGPADGHLLAQPVSQQEYTRLFDHDNYGFSTDTKYLSRGAIDQYAAFYGTQKNTSYAVESDYKNDPGQTPNGSQTSSLFSLKLKQMLTPNDGLFFEILDMHRNCGDLSQRYDPKQADLGLKSEEKQEPSVMIGLNHKWSETQDTLVLASFFNDNYRVNDPAGSTYLLAADTNGVPTALFPIDLTQNYNCHLTVSSLELQQLIHGEFLQTVAGIRLQYANNQLTDSQTINVGNASSFESYFGNPGTVITRQSLKLESERVSPYLYEYWQVAEKVQLIGGLSYDYQMQPKNSMLAPLSNQQNALHQLSPKLALVWTPQKNSTIRVAYTRSLSGVDLDQSVRLEPSQIAGFVQAYRTLFPDALTGGVSGQKHETADVSFEHVFATRTYIALGGQCLWSKADEDVGAFKVVGISPFTGFSQLNERLAFHEFSADASVHQLLGERFSVGARYRLAKAQLDTTFPGINPAVGPLNGFTLSPIPSRQSGLIQTISLDGTYRLPCGFFARTQIGWWSQQLADGLRGSPGDNFWQLNLEAGYRSPHQHLELTLGLLNLADQNYRLSPINLYPDLPRERTFALRLKLNF